MDRSGIAWVTGEFAGTANFGGISRTAAGVVGQADIFVARYNPVGEVLSVYQAGGTNYDIGFAVATDAGGTAYVTGDYVGVANFGATSLTNLSGRSETYSSRGWHPASRVRH